MSRKRRWRWNKQDFEGDSPFSCTIKFSKRLHFDLVPAQQSCSDDRNVYLFMWKCGIHLSASREFICEQIRSERLWVITQVFYGHSTHHCTWFFGGGGWEKGCDKSWKKIPFLFHQPVAGKPLFWMIEDVHFVDWTLKKPWLQLKNQSASDKDSKRVKGFLKLSKNLMNRPKNAFVSACESILKSISFMQNV